MSECPCLQISQVTLWLENSSCASSSFCMFAFLQMWITIPGSCRVLLKTDDKEVAFGCIPEDVSMYPFRHPGGGKWGPGGRAGAGEARKSQKTMTGAQRTLFLGEAHWCSEHWLPNSTLFYICAVPSNRDWCLEEHSQTCCRLSFSPETQSLPLLIQVRFSGFNCWILCLKKNLLAVQR